MWLERETRECFSKETGVPGNVVWWKIENRLNEIFLQEKHTFLKPLLLEKHDVLIYSVIHQPAYFQVILLLIY